MAEDDRSPTRCRWAGRSLSADPGLLEPVGCSWQRSLRGTPGMRAVPGPAGRAAWGRDAAAERGAAGPAGGAGGGGPGGFLSGSVAAGRERVSPAALRAFLRRVFFAKWLLFLDAGSC